MNDHPECPKGYEILHLGEVIDYSTLTLQRDGSIRHPFPAAIGLKLGTPQLPERNVGRYIRKRFDGRKVKR